MVEAEGSGSVKHFVVDAKVSERVECSLMVQY